MSIGSSESGPRSRSDLERYLEHYVRYLTLERGRSHNTVAAYTRDVQAYLDYLQSRGIEKPEGIDSSHVEAFIHSLDGAATTVARKLSSIKNFHRYLVDEKVAVDDVTSSVAPPAVERVGSSNTARDRGR